jgi:heptosyltransferase-2
MKILIIQQKMIGDVLTSCILFEAIKRVYPLAELHYVINKHTYAVVENNPFIDKIHFFNLEQQKSNLKLLKFAWRLRKEKYDAVIDVYSKISSNLIILFSGAKIKVSKDKWYTSMFYSHTYKLAKTPKTNAGLAIENRLKLLQSIGIIQSEIVQPKIYLTEDEKNKAKAFLKSNAIDLSKPLYMISVIGSSKTKTYPFDYMAQVTDAVSNENPNNQILFNYIPNQKAEAKAIFDLCKSSTQSQIAFEVFGKSLREFLAITYHCTALIGNEGGAINMAKALDISTFTIYSPWIRKESWSMFEDGKKHVSVHLKDFEPRLYQEKSTKELKANADNLYEIFYPKYFTEILNTFLKNSLLQFKQ